MTQAQAEKLKVGDKVQWRDNPELTAEVIDAGYNAVTVRWSDGQVGILYHAQADSIERYEPFASE